MDLMLRYYPVATVAGWPARSGTARAFDRGFDEIGLAGQAGAASPARTSTSWPRRTSSSSRCRG